LPVEKIFIKQQIDLLTAQAWFKDTKKLVKKVVEVSCEHSIPSQYTSLVAFETTREKLEKQNLLDIDEDIDDVEEKDGGGGGSSSKKGKGKKEKGKMKGSKLKNKKWSKLKNKKGTVAALAIGGTAAVVAVSMAGFGDMQATMDNVGVFDGGDFDLLSSSPSIACLCVTLPCVRAAMWGMIAAGIVTVATAIMTVPSCDGRRYDF